MKCGSGSRPKLGFQPQLERSESRLLLSAGGLVHAEVSRSALPQDVVSRGYADYIVGRSTKYYSLVLTNNTNRQLQVSITAKSESKGRADLEGDFGKFVQNAKQVTGTVANGGKILLFTDDAADTFTVTMSVESPHIELAHGFAQGKTINASEFKFPVFTNWTLNTSTALADQFKVVAMPTDKPTRLEVQAG